MKFIIIFILVLFQNKQIKFICERDQVNFTPLAQWKDHFHMFTQLFQKLN